MAREGGRDYEIADDREEDIDVEAVISKTEKKYSDYINDDNLVHFNEIFDAARRTYSDPDVQKDWDVLFEDLETALQSADEDDIDSVLQGYARKANGLG
ncbi:MAG TPA: hypothetical protein VL306_02415 [Methylomirabilota bacterium]|nr:hypothetical protein [Methylomirabilota bacterium]